jgi:hypothetical protein
LDNDVATLGELLASSRKPNLCRLGQSSSDEKSKRNEGVHFGKWIVECRMGYEQDKNPFLEV